MPVLIFVDRYSEGTLISPVSDEFSGAIARRFLPMTSLEHENHDPGYGLRIPPCPGIKSTYSAQPKTRLR